MPRELEPDVLGTVAMMGESDERVRAWDDIVQRFGGV